MVLGRPFHLIRIWVNIAALPAMCIWSDRERELCVSWCLGRIRRSPEVRGGAFLSSPFCCDASCVLPLMDYQGLASHRTLRISLFPFFVTLVLPKTSVLIAATLGDVAGRFLLGYYYLAWVRLRLSIVTNSFLPAAWAN